VLAVLAAAALTYSLMQSLVIPALPAIQRALDASPDQTSWTVTGFLLSSSVATPIAGRLGDLFGKRRVLVAILAIVTAGTLLCVVPSIEALVAGRVVQGASGGVLPLAYAIVRDELRPARVSHGIAILAAMLGVGGGLGVIGAGLLVEHLSYTWMFWLQIPGFVAVGYGIQRWVPDSGESSGVRIDWLGATLVSTGLVALLLTVTQARSWGATSAETLAGGGTAIVFLGAWLRSALRRPEPLLDVRMMRRRPIWTTNSVAFMVGVAQFAGFILVPQYVQEPEATGYGFGASPLASGLFLLPMTIGVLLIGLAAGRLERRFGARALLVSGNLVTLWSFLLLTFFRDTALEVYTASALLGVGTGIAIAALATLIVSNVGPEETGAAAGVNNVARTLGGAVGAQIAAALLAAAAGAAGLHDAGGYTQAFAVGLTAVVAATVLGPLLPRRLEEPTAAPVLPGRSAPGLAYRR
jgi:MFS family permease